MYWASCLWLSGKSPSLNYTGRQAVNCCQIEQWDCMLHNLWAKQLTYANILIQTNYNTWMPFQLNGICSIWISFFPSAITNEGSVTEPQRPWYALDKTISAPLSPLQPADKGMNGGMEECMYLEKGHQGASGSRETWLAVLLPLGSFEAALIGFVPLWAEDRNCQCVQSCQTLTTVHRRLWCEWTSEWMNARMKDWGQSSLFLTFTTAAWSHALMNNGNHLTRALCLFSLSIL